MTEAALYSWDGVADRYEEIYRAILRTDVSAPSLPEGKVA
jgi:hypothetical protein